eukprot:6246995-Prymnesium_polylepis.1
MEGAPPPIPKLGTPHGRLFSRSLRSASAASSCIAHPSLRERSPSLLSAFAARCATPKVCEPTAAPRLPSESIVCALQSPRSCGPRVRPHRAAGGRRLRRVREGRGCAR